MALRFRQSYQLFPGVRLNVSRRGLSATFGVPGASINVGPQGVRGTVGLPGTGISYSTKLAPRPVTDETYWVPQRRSSTSMRDQAVSRPMNRVIGSAPVERLTSESLDDLKEMLVSARAQRSDLESQYGEAVSLLGKQQRKRRRRSFVLWRAMFRRSRERLASAMVETAAEGDRLADWLNSTHVDVDFDFGDGAAKAFAGLARAYDAIRGSSIVWDVTADRRTDRFLERTEAHRTLDRKPVKLDYAASELIRFDGRAICFANANGEDLLIYPGLSIMPRKDGAFALLDLRDVDLTTTQVGFLERDAIPPDAGDGGFSWEKPHHLIILRLVEQRVLVHHAHRRPRSRPASAGRRCRPRRACEARRSSAAPAAGRWRRRSTSAPPSAAPAAVHPRAAA